MKEYFETFFPAGHNMRILLADDHRTNLELMAFCLEEHGFDNILMAGNGKEALEQYQESNDEIIVVVSDVQMPVMTGLELVRNLRSKPDTAEIPVVMLTARDFAIEDSQKKELNISACVSKPFSPRELLQSVEEVLKESVAV